MFTKSLQLSLGAPPVGVVKLNFHGVYSRKNCSVGISVVVRNDIGELMDEVSLQQSTSFSIEAEAQVASKASELAQRYPDRKIIFEGQSALFIKSIVDSSIVNLDWIIYSLVEDIKGDCKNTGDFTWIVCNNMKYLAASHIAGILVETVVFGDVSWIPIAPPSWMKNPS